MKTTTPQQSRFLPRFSMALLAPRYWLLWLLLAVFYVFSWLPVAVIDRVANRLGDFAAKKNRKRALVARRNLELCFPDKHPDEIEILIRDHFRAYLRSLLHYPLIWWAPRWRLQRHIELQGEELIAQQRVQGKNIIILTCHSVGLEFSVAALTKYTACAGPYKAMAHPLLNWLVARGRQQNNARVFTRDEGLRPLVQMARKGRAIIYLADEDLGPEVSVFVPFFGVQKATISVLGRLAKTCNAAVLPCISCYDAASRKYRVRLLPALQDFPQGDDQINARVMNAAIEAAVRECLPQYFWTMKWFRTRPPGEADLYMGEYQDSQ